MTEYKSIEAVPVTGNFTNAKIRLNEAIIRCTNLEILISKLYDNRETRLHGDEAGPSRPRQAPEKVSHSSFPGESGLSAAY